MDHPTSTPVGGSCCGQGEACCTPARAPMSVSRRTVLGAGLGAALAASLPAGAVAVPADKHLDPRWVEGIAARGSATRSTGTALARIGMPTGGACAGQVYASGDGRLWLWDVLNDDASWYGGTDFDGLHYRDPLTVRSPFRTGFALRASGGGRTVTATLDDDGFEDVTFTGAYPVGTVDYASSRMPATVRLRMFSPFVPTSLHDSDLPATVLEYTVRNTGRTTQTYELLGFAENPVGLRSRTAQPLRLTARAHTPGTSAAVEFGAEVVTVDDPSGDDVVFEDWSGDGWGDWTVTGTAFGPGPVDVDQVPPEMRRFGALGTSGSRFVTSYAFRAGSGAPDDATGRLVSRTFTVTHRGILTRVGGGNGAGLRVDVVVDGQVVASATGLRSEVLRPVYLDLAEHLGKEAHLEVVDDAKGPWAHLSCDRFVFSNREGLRSETVFEDWADGSYDGWTVSGDAFGASPVTEAATPDYFRREGSLQLIGRYLVTSHAFRAHPDAGAADVPTGTLTSRTFTIDQRYLVANIGGGADAAHVGLRVVVDGEVVATLAGSNAETLSVKAVDLSAYRGREAHLEVFDDASGGWGHVNCERIWFSDLPLQLRPLGELRDAGTFAVAALEPAAQVRPSLQRWDDADDWFDSPTGPAATDDGRQAGAVSYRFRLRPRQERTVRFAVAWHFPRVSAAKFAAIQGAQELRHHYATRFATASDVVAHVAERAEDLSRTTQDFVATWYDRSTLPHWFLERTLAPASTVATETCQRFDSGRFYAWEGTYCCAGTCTHVWNYAQSVAYLFPELERDARSRVDFGLAFHEDTGAIDYRGEAGRNVAHDGQCGNVLRVYREHQMSTSDDFLRALWPQVRKATEYLIGHDGDRPDGILESDQYNTLDATWYGEIPWISGLYVAALHAAAEMAVDMGDDAFARTCRTIAAAGSERLADDLWNERYQYFEHRVDPAHPEAVNSNRGCYIDQMFGQTYAHQLGLPRVFEADKASAALRSIYRNNFLPDAAAYKEESGIPGGRVFTTDQEAGTLMCTWPFGGADEAPGTDGIFAVAYFNEVWTGTEWQFAAHLLADGQVEEGLAVARAIYDRHLATKRNPYNEVECSDHYARSMMAHAAYLAALGFEHHGPRGHLGFAPKVGPEAFRAAFTVGAGWGSFSQERRRNGQTNEVELRYGRLEGLRTLALDVTAPVSRVRVSHQRGHKSSDVRVTHDAARAGRLVLSFSRPLDLTAGDRLTVSLR